MSQDNEMVDERRRHSFAAAAAAAYLYGRARDFLNIRLCSAYYMYICVRYIGI